MTTTLAAAAVLPLLAPAAVAFAPLRYRTRRKGYPRCEQRILFEAWEEEGRESSVEGGSGRTRTPAAPGLRGSPVNFCDTNWLHTMLRAFSARRSVVRCARLLSSRPSGSRPIVEQAKSPDEDEFDPSYVSPEALRKRAEAMRAMSMEAAEKAEAPFEDLMRKLSPADRRYVRRELRKEEGDGEGYVSDEGPSDANDDPTHGSPDDPNADPGLGPDGPVLEQFERTVGQMEQIFEKLGKPGPRSGRPASHAGAKRGPMSSPPPLDESFWRSAPVAAPHLQRPTADASGEGGSSIPQHVSKAALRRKRAAVARAASFSDMQAMLQMGPVSATGSSKHGAAEAAHSPPSPFLGRSGRPDGEPLYNAVAEEAPGGGVRPKRSEAPTAAASPLASSPTAASPFSLACAALGIDPYAVTPAALGIAPAPSAGDGAEDDEDAAAAAEDAWEDALAAVDLEEEGGGLPAHCPRTGRLLTDRQRRGYALARAALAFFPIDDPAISWVSLSGKGLTVEAVLQAAGLDTEDLGARDAAGENTQVAVRLKVRAALLRIAAGEPVPLVRRTPPPPQRRGSSAGGKAAKGATQSQISRWR